MNARYYLPAIGRFLSADTLVPNPANPQSFNRYTYVRNNPINRADPSGHVDCGLLGDTNDVNACQQAPKTPKLTDVLSSVEPVFDGIPIKDVLYVNGFGANSMTYEFANPNSPNYTGIYSAESAGIHPGLDFGRKYDETCAECMYVYSTVPGVVVNDIYQGDADPNVVIFLDNGLYAIYGHVHISIAPGTRVNPGDVIGSLQDQRIYTTNSDGSLKLDYDNSHVHLTLRSGIRVFNPVYFFKDPSVLGSYSWNYSPGESLYSISSYQYTRGVSFWSDPLTVFGGTRY